jgi:hypothetical protein
VLITNHLTNLLKQGCRLICFHDVIGGQLLLFTCTA